MDKIDFSKLDGFPLDQDVMSFLQNAKLRGDVSLFADCPADTIVILSGLQVTNTTGTVFQLSAGYFYLNGQVYFTSGNSQNIAGAGLNELGMTVQFNLEGLVFEDDTVKNVVIKDAPFLDLKADGTANFYPVRNWKAWHDYSFSRSKTAEFSQSVSGGLNGGLTGTVYFRKNTVANTLHIRGTITAADAQALYAPATYAALMTLPEGYRPAYDVPFAAFYRYHTTARKKTHDAVDYLMQVNAALRADGILQAGFIRPEAGVTSYSVSFNTIIPLD